MKLADNYPKQPCFNAAQIRARIEEVKGEWIGSDSIGKDWQPIARFQPTQQSQTRYFAPGQQVTVEARTVPTQVAGRTATYYRVCFGGLRLVTGPECLQLTLHLAIAARNGLLAQDSEDVTVQRFDLESLGATFQLITNSTDNKDVHDICEGAIAKQIQMGGEL